MSIFKKLLIVFGAIILLIGTVVGVAVLRFDSTDVNKEVIRYIESSSNVRPEIKGKITFALWPNPHVVIRDVELISQDEDHDLPLAVVPSINAHVGVSSFLLGKTNISKIVLNNPVINIELSRRGKWNWGMKRSNEVNTTEMVLHYGIINYYSQASDFFKRFEQVNVTINADSLSGPFSVKGNFDVRQGINNRHYTIDAMVTVDGSTTDLEAMLGSEHFNLEYEGKLERVSDGGIQSDGNVTITGSSFPDFFWTLLSGEIQIEKGVRRYSADDPFTVRAEVSNNHKQMSINNIEIMSQTLVGRGEIRSLVERKTVTEIDLDIEYIGLNNLLSSSQGWQMSIGDVIIPEQSIVADISIDELNYLTDKASNISIGIQSAGRALEVSSLVAYLPGKGKVEFSGDFHKLHWNSDVDSYGDDSHINKEAVPILKGDFYGSGESLRAIFDWLHVKSSVINEEKLKNYAVQGKLRVAPYVIELFDVKALVDSTFFRGSSQISHSIGRTKILNKVEIEKFNIDEYVDTSMYTANFDPTRFFREYTQSDVDIYFESDVSQLVMNDSVINDLFFVMAVNPASVGFERVSMRSDNADFDASVVLDLRGLDPVVKIEFNARSLDTKIFRKQNKPVEAAVSTNRVLWSQEPLDISWLTKFNGNINVRMESLKHNNLELSNLIFLGKMKDYELKIDTFTAQVADGTLELKGKIIGTSIPTFGVSFSITKADIKSLLTALLGYSIFDGQVSLVGSLGSTGFTAERLISQMYGSFSFAARGVEVSGINLHHLIDNLFVVPEERVIDLMAEDLSTGKTQLYSADGIFTIKAGLLSIKEMVMATTRTSGAMNGNFDLRTWLMSMISNFSFIAYDPKVGKNVSLSLGIKVSGPADNLKVDNNFRTINRYFQRRAEEQQVKKR